MPTLQAAMGGFANRQMVGAVFPEFRSVPWLRQLQQTSMVRCGRQMNHGEIGCLLSHRRAWKSFLNSDYTRALILESDSEISGKDMVCKIIEEFGEQYDILFLGSYHGRTKLKRSTAESFGLHHKIGSPLPNTLYCTYGYAINKNAARHLLQQTGKVSWPVDYWDKWLTDGCGNFEIRVAAVVPEVISTWAAPSTIQDIQVVKRAEKLPRRVRYFVGEIKNSIVGYFC
jgi:GR25 family glycosyltransferase involved in LPS biosynthesis